MSNPYETARYLSEYLLFHYGTPKDVCPFSFVPADLLRFHERIRKQCLLPTKPGRLRALDIGCAVGRFTFELAHVADELLGLDNSRAFITTAKRLAKNRTATIRVHESGNQFSTHKIRLPRTLKSGRVHFAVGDAMNLRKHQPSPYHIIAAINLLCRLTSPRKFLQQIPPLVQPGGQFILASPFSWLGGFTPKHEWLTPEAVVKILRPHFQLARQRDLPFMIREHRRKYQLVISNVMTFRRL